MADIFEAVALGAPRRQRQHGVEAVERLNGRLLVHGKHGCVVRRIHVQSDHVRRLGLELGIVRLHVAREAMRLQPRALPRFGDEVVMDLQHAPQLARIQCVVPSAGPWRVFSKMRASMVGVRIVGG